MVPTSFIEDVLVGALSALTVLYAFQTRVAYPSFVLKTLEHPWIIVVCFIIAIYIYQLSPSISVLLILLLLAFVADTLIFVRSVNETPATYLSRQTVENATPSFMQAYDTDVGIPLSQVSTRYSLFTEDVSKDRYATF